MHFLLPDSYLIFWTLFPSNWLHFPKYLLIFQLATSFLCPFPWQKVAAISSTTGMCQKFTRGGKSHLEGKFARGSHLSWVKYLIHAGPGYNRIETNNKLCEWDMGELLRSNNDAGDHKFTQKIQKILVKYFYAKSKNLAFCKWIPEKPDNSSISYVDMSSHSSNWLRSFSSILSCFAAEFDCWLASNLRRLM